MKVLTVYEKILKCSNSLLLLLICLTVLSCGTGSDEPFNSNFDESSSSGGRYLYVVSGGCYGGGVTLSAGSATVSRFYKDTGEFDRVLVDYASIAAGDMPVAIIDKDENTLHVVVENTGGRRVDTIDKNTFSVSTYLTNTTALNGVMRNAKLLSDGSMLISKSTAIEKFSAGKARVTMGANPYVSAPAAPCATTATLITSVSTLSNGKILYTHSAASPNNKIGLISSTGYASAANCLATQASPATTALPTSTLVHSSGKVLVAYGSTTAASNFIYSYDVDPSTNIFSNITAAYTDFANVYGPSAMTEDPETSDVFIANALNTYNNIERFSYDPTTRTLTKQGATPFISANIYTRCISGMVVGD